MKGLGEYATSVVRLFPDYAESPIWFAHPVPYETSRLDADLVLELQTWERSYYAGLTPQHEWRSAELAQEFAATGLRLARRIADQLGDDFQVQVDLGESQTRVRGSGPARNPEAAAAFCRLVDEARSEWEQRQRGVARGETFHWRVCEALPRPRLS